MRRKRKIVITKDDLNGATNEIEFLNTRGRNFDIKTTRCIESWLGFSLYRRNPNEALKEINSLKIRGGNGKVDKEKTIAARKKMFEKTFGNSPLYEFCEKTGEARKTG